MKSFKELLEESAEPITKSQLNSLEKILDDLFRVLDIDIEFTRHFLDRVNDRRNQIQITVQELEKLFRSTYQRYGKKIHNMRDKAEAVLVDMSTNINLPFVIRVNRKTDELELVSKTVMRKRDFRTRDQKLVV